MTSEDYEEFPYPQEYDYLWTEKRNSKYEENRAVRSSWWFRQDEAAERRGVNDLDPFLAAFVVGVAYTAFLLLSPLINPPERLKLQNDPMCGIPTGGQVSKHFEGNLGTMSLILFTFRRSAGGTVRFYQTLS